MTHSTKLLETKKEIIFSPASYEHQPQEYYNAIAFIAPWANKPFALPKIDSIPYRLIRNATLRGSLAYQHLHEIARFKNTSLATINQEIISAADSMDIEDTELSREILRQGMRPSLLANSSALESLVWLQRFFHSPKIHYEPTQLKTLDQHDTQEFILLQFQRLDNVLCMYCAAHIKQKTNHDLAYKSTIMQQQ
jgi:hypothetical protein